MDKWSSSIQKKAALLFVLSLALHCVPVASIQSARRDEAECALNINEPPPEVGINRTTAKILFEKPTDEKVNYEIVLLEPFTLQDCENLGKSSHVFEANFSQARRCTATSNDGRLLWGMAKELVRQTNPHCAPGGDVENVAMEHHFCWGVEMEHEVLLSSSNLWSTVLRGCVHLPCTNVVAVTPLINFIFTAPKYFGEPVHVTIEHSNPSMQNVADIAFSEMSIVPVFVVPLEDRKITIWPATSQRKGIEVHNAKNMTFTLRYQDVQLSNYIILATVDITLADAGGTRTRRRLVTEQARTPVLTGEHMVKTFVHIVWENVTKTQFDNKLSLQLRSALSNCGSDGMGLGISDVKIYNAIEVTTARRSLDDPTPSPKLLVDASITSPYPKAPTITAPAFKDWLLFLSLPSDASIDVVRVEVASPNASSIQVIPVPRDDSQGQDELDFIAERQSQPALLASTQGLAIVALATALAALVGCVILRRLRAPITDGRTESPGKNLEAVGVVSGAWTSPRHCVSEP